MKLKDLVTLYFKSSLILLASPCVSRTPPKNSKLETQIFF